MNIPPTLGPPYTVPLLGGWEEPKLTVSDETLQEKKNYEKPTMYRIVALYSIFAQTDHTIHSTTP